MVQYTVFCDIDGVILKHENAGAVEQFRNHHELLPNVHEMFDKWAADSAYIILCSGRPQSCRDSLVSELLRHGLFWHKLIMGLPRGKRIVINDAKPTGTITVQALCLDRNRGFPCSM